MVAQAPVKNHAAGRGERAHRLVDRDWFLEGEQCSGGIETGSALVASHDDERNRALSVRRSLEFAKELRASIQIAIDDKCVDL